MRVTGSKRSRHCANPKPTATDTEYRSTAKIYWMNSKRHDQIRRELPSEGNVDWSRLTRRHGMPTRKLAYRLTKYSAMMTSHIDCTARRLIVFSAIRREKRRPSRLH